MPARCNAGPTGKIVGIAVDHDLGVLQVLQTRHIFAERGLAGGADLIVAFREQYVAGDDPLILCLHLGDLGLLCSRLGASRLQLLGLRFVRLFRYARRQDQRGERNSPRRGLQVDDHGPISEWVKSAGQGLPEAQA
jgi:hypothetical protein